MNIVETLARIGDAVMLDSADAAIRVHAEYEPQMGPRAKVYPPTYIADSDGEKYHLEKRWDSDGEEADVVVIDSIQSQAARAEKALASYIEALGLPVIALDTSIEDEETGEVRSLRITSLDAPHRSRDAYFLDATLDGVLFDKTEVGKELLAASNEDTTAYLKYSPGDLLFGVWDSHRGKRLPTKFARAYTSEIIGWSPLRGKKAATKTDPLVLKGDSKVPLDEWRPDIESKQKAKKEVKLSELGYGMVPVAPSSEAGGVSVKNISRSAIVSLTSLSRYHFGADGACNREGRTALAALALLADRAAFAGAGVHLRSGSDLVIVSETLEWVQPGGVVETLELSVSDAEQLVLAAKEALVSKGVIWESSPVVLQPAEHLQRAIEQVYLARELKDEE